jgi:hypothetical protein
MQAARYLGAITCCKSFAFSDLHQALRASIAFWLMAARRVQLRTSADVSLYKLLAGHSRKGRATQTLTSVSNLREFT